MTEPSYHLVPGRVVLAGQVPTGARVPFVPDDPDRVAMSVRLQGIDAPEIAHFGQSQPLALAARRALLSWIGFREVAYASDGRTVACSSPTSVPVTFALPAAQGSTPASGHLFRVRSALRPLAMDAQDLPLGTTASCAMLREGHAYYLAYESLPPSHREYLRNVAQRARSALRGVWAHDATSRGFVPLRALGPAGALVFPMLFRRCVEFLRQRGRGFRGSLLEWLTAHVQDRVHGGSHFLPFGALMRERPPMVALRADTLDLVFEGT